MSPVEPNTPAFNYAFCVLLRHLHCTQPFEPWTHIPEPATHAPTGSAPYASTEAQQDRTWPQRSLNMSSKEHYHEQPKLFCFVGPEIAPKWRGLVFMQIHPFAAMPPATQIRSNLPLFAHETLLPKVPCRHKPGPTKKQNIPSANQQYLLWCARAPPLLLRSTTPCAVPALSVTDAGFNKYSFDRCTCSSTMSFKGWGC